MRRFFPVTLALMLAGIAVADSNQANIAKGQEIAETICVACHNTDGNSSIPMYPRVAGQHTAYLEAQSKAIRDGVRTWGLAAAMQPSIETLSDEDLHNVSVYYNQQLATAGEADPNLNLALGSKIYRGGLKNQKVPACMSCHGPSGQGIPSASIAKDGIVAFPRVTGQHKDYIVTQMEAFRSGERQHAMMDPIAQRLTDEEIEAVANFIQGLR